MSHDEKRNIMERILRNQLTSQAKQKVGSSKTNAKPTPYQKKDGNWYCTYNGRQYYLGSTTLKAQQKLEKILKGEGESITSGELSLSKVVDAYMKSLVNNQSPDTIRVKRRIYRMV